jgi:HK97 family phage major capsid protein
VRDKRLAKLLDRKAAAVAEMKTIVEACDREHRDRLTKEQDHRFQFLKADVEKLNEQIEQARNQRESELCSLTGSVYQVGSDDPVGDAERKAGIANSLYRNMPKMPTSFTEIYKQQRAERGTLAVAEPPSQWVDAQSGDTVEVLSADERLSREGDERQLHFGRLIRGLVTSKWQDSDREKQYLAQSGNINAAGGVLVADELAQGFIDKVRAAMVCLRAGAKTVPFSGTDVLRIARVTTDPTFTIKAENDPFPSTQVAFDAIQLIPRTIGAVIALSRELLEDTGNIVDLLETVLSKALAVKLDSLALAGTGSQQPVGLLTMPGISGTGSIGTLSWGALQTGATAIRNSNIEPTSYICSPTNQNRLASLTTGDGVNSAKLWLPPPSNIAPLEQLVTTSMPDGSILVGDFSRLLLGVRSETRLEVSTEAGTAFQNHQCLIKVTTRWDVNTEHNEAFYTLTGITG